MSWRDIFKDAELSGYRAGGHGQRIGFGKKAAIVVVDMINLYVSPQFALGHGDNTPAVVAANKRLIQSARVKSLPIFFSNVGLRRSAAEKGVWGIKVGGSKEITVEADTIVSELSPADSDIIVTKAKASVFFGTQLASMLVNLGIDTIIVTGVTTSGCVRATVVDGFSHNFRVIVPAECVGDRAALPHKVSLFDMDMKYSDVMDLDEVLHSIAAM